VDGIIIDGSNLTRTPDGAASLSRLDAAIDQVAALLAPRPSTRLRVVVDASLRHHLIADDRSMLERHIKSGRIEQTPAGIDGDVFILSWADDHQAIVISNDLFRPYTDKYPWLASAGRCIAADFDPPSGRWRFFERNAGPARRARNLSELLSFAPSGNGQALAPTLPTPSGATGSTGGADPRTPPKAIASMGPHVAAGWYEDPSGRFDHRYWSGVDWTPRVARSGVESNDAFPSRPPGHDYRSGSGWYVDPSGRHQLRWWSSAVWTRHVADGSATSIDPVPGITTEMEAPQSAVARDWYSDPCGRYELRYWDGAAWTEHVSTGGVRSLDPPVM
jgi:hypothetical protein